MSTPSTATAAAASTQSSTIATITEAAQRISPRSQAVQKTLPSQAILKQTTSGTVQSRQAGEASKGSSSGTAGSSTGAGESTESQVQRQLGVTVHAEGFRASVTKYAEDLAKPPAGDSAGEASKDSSNGPQSGTAGSSTATGESTLSEVQRHLMANRAAMIECHRALINKPPCESRGISAEPQTSEDTHRPLREVMSPRLYKRPAPEVSIPPAVTTGGPSPAQSSGQPSPEKESGAAVSADALPSPVSAQSSTVQVPVQAPQPPQPVAQQHGSEQQASSTAQAGSPGRVQPQAQLPGTSVPGGSASVQQQVPGALNGPTKQLAPAAAPIVPGPAVPPRRVPLPKLPRVPLPKLGGSTLAPPRPVYLPSGRSTNLTWLMLTQSASRFSCELLIARGRVVMQEGAAAGSFKSPCYFEETMVQIKIVRALRSHCSWEAAQGCL